MFPYIKASPTREDWDSSFQGRGERKPCEAWALEESEPSPRKSVPRLPDAHFGVPVSTEEKNMGVSGPSAIEPFHAGFSEAGWHFSSQKGEL